MSSSTVCILISIVVYLVTGLLMEYHFMSKNEMA